MRPSAIVGILLTLVALTIYVVSYFTTSRVTTVTMLNGELLRVRLMSQPWRDCYRPLGVVEEAIRGKGFGVGYNES